MEGTVFTYSFWADAAERAIKSAAQALILVFAGVQAWNPLATSTDEWKIYLGGAVGAAVLSLLTSVATNAATGTASVVSDPNTAVANEEAVLVATPNA